MENDGLKDYSSHNSKMTMSERVKKILKLNTTIIPDKVDPYETYIEHPLLNLDHVKLLAKLPKKITFSVDPEIDNESEITLNINEWYSDDLIEAYQLLEEYGESPYPDEYSRELKANIKELKLSFNVTFWLYDDGRKFDLAYYELKYQDVNFREARELQPGRYEKYYTGNIKEKILRWLDDAKLPVGGKKTIFFQEEK